MAKKHRPKGEMKFFGTTFKLAEPGKFVRGEPQRKPRPDTGDERKTKTWQTLKS